MKPRGELGDSGTDPMSDEEGPTSGPAGLRERKRQGPTIHLEATSGGEPRKPDRPDWALRIREAFASVLRALWFRLQQLAGMLRQRLPQITTWKPSWNLPRNIPQNVPW